MPRLSRKPDPIRVTSLKDRMADHLLELKKILNEEHLRGETIIFMMEKQEKAVNELTKAILRANKLVLEALSPASTDEIRLKNDQAMASAKEFLLNKNNASHTK